MHCGIQTRRQFKDNDFDRAVKESLEIVKNPKIKGGDQNLNSLDPIHYNSYEDEQMA